MKYNLFFYYWKQKALNDYFNVPLKCYKSEIHPLNKNLNIEKVKNIYEAM